MTNHREARGRQAGGVKSNRNRLIAAVHAAARKAGLDQDAYRDTLERITGKRSASDLTPHLLARVLDELNRLASPHQGYRVRWRTKAAALWRSLYWLGEVDDISDAAMDAFIVGQTGVANARWVRGDKGVAVIEALKSWCGRAGVRWNPAITNQAICVAEAIWEKLHAAGAVSNKHACHAWARAFWGGIWPGYEPRSDEAWNQIIEALGKRLRAHRASSGVGATTPL